MRKSRRAHRGLHKLTDKFRMKQYKREQAVMQEKEYILNRRWQTYLQENLQLVMGDKRNVR